MNPNTRFWGRVGDRRAWRRLPPLLQSVTHLSCALIVVLVTVLLIFDHCGLDRTGTKLIRAGFAADPDLDAVQTAIEATDEAALRRLLRKPGLDLNALDSYGKRPLTRAAQFGWVAGCRLLIDSGADVTATDNRGSPPLVCVTVNGGGAGGKAGGGEIVDLLIRQGADVNERGYGGNTPLIHAAFSGNPEQIKRLLRAGAEVNAANDDGFTALHAAAERDDVASVNLLLAAGADATAKDDAGATPLIVARAQAALAAAGSLKRL
jgi:ankyrin repeat protein